MSYTNQMDKTKIVNRVPELLREQNRRQGRPTGLNTLIEGTGLSHVSVARWRDNKLARFDARAIAAWVDYFGLSSVDELLGVEKGNSVG